MRSMDWVNARRAEFILLHLSRRGHLRRSDLMSEFSVAVPTASAIIRRFQADHEGAMEYNMTTKSYVPDELFPAYLDELLETLKSRANQGASCG